MDKNTLMGMLLMGLVIFGFMFLNQPSAEQLEQKRTEQMQGEVAADNTETKALILDSITPADAEMLRNAVRMYGRQDSSACVYTSDKINIRLDGDRLQGSVITSAGAIDIQQILTSSVPDLRTGIEAANIVHNTLNELSRYKNFAAHLNGKEETIELSNSQIALTLSTKGAQISSAILKNYDCYLNGDTTAVCLWNGNTNNYSFTLNSASQRFDTDNFYFEPVIENDSTVLMRLDLGAGSWWGIRYTLPDESYLVKMDVVQHGMERNAIIPPSVATMEFKWHQKMRRNEEGRMFEEQKSALTYQLLGDKVKELSERSTDDKTVNEPLKWIAFKNQFFSSVLISDSKFNNAKLHSESLSDDLVYLKDMTASTQVDYSSANDSVASFNFYLGPNLYPLLNSIDKQLAGEGDSLELTRLIPLGWNWLRWVNTLIVIPTFTFLGQYISNYGIIILLLTIFIKLILFPFTYKSYMSQAKMRVLAPEIKEINDKYPGQENAMVRQQKTMELYNKAGANPMSGCLPMLLQMPVLIALFWFFPSCIELRGQSFLWAHDLSAPDAIVSWTTNIPFISGTFGNHISLFCMLMTVTNILYTRINMQNQPTSQNMPGMKLMQYGMPLIFLFWFNNYASGLSYYYFLSLLITILQTYAIRYSIDEKKVRAKMLENAKKPRKKNSWMARLEEVNRQQQALMREQQKQKGKRR